jgi:hypothetical protein
MVTSAGVLYLLAPALLRGLLPAATQLVTAIGLTILLAKIFLLRIREIPFTATRVPATTDLPISFVRYSVVFPAFVLLVVDHEPWIEASAVHLFMTVIGFVVVYMLLTHLRRLYLKKREAESAAADAVFIHRLGLQE